MLPPGPDLIASFSAQHHHQDQSPLFTRIPPEIRNTIFLYALLIYEDLSTIYPDDTHYSRPGYRHALRIDPQLLRTCRLVYLEPRLLPLDAVDEHVFWCHRAPPGIKFAGEAAKYLARFTEEQKDKIERMHFFIQQYYLEGTFPRMCMLPDMRPRSMKITLRHGDWWSWESNEPLILEDRWSNGLGLLFLFMPHQFRFTDNSSFKIYAIADRVSKETITLNNGRILCAADNAIVRKEWIGPSTRLPDLRYDQTSKTWVDRDEVAEQDVPDPGLKYCIVVVNWTVPREST
ncbi:hypothetical protein C8R42DRAFT_717685 [Lentinula raphanica]|nr:hypothetical protein C8R42DRAFT_717685 [Lentinula raphanica]